MRALAIAGANVKRMLRERSNIFFVFVFPIALILLIGAQFGGGVDPAIGLYSSSGDDLNGRIISELRSIDGLDVIDYETEAELTRAVERGQVEAGVFLPGSLDESAAGSSPIEVGFVARADSIGPQIQSVVGAALARVTRPVSAARFASREVGVDFETSYVVARGIADSAPGIDVDVSTAGEALFPSSLGRFDLGASQQLVLFVFLTALAGSTALILSRQLGVTRRMLSTPTSAGTVVLGEAAGRWAVAMIQGIYIMLATFLMFRVNWGDPLGALLVLMAFSAVGAGAGMLMGAVFRNEQQAGGISIVVSLGLAALGGSMLPNELFSPFMQKVAHFTPHAWAIDGFAELVRRDGRVGDILTELGVLVAYAAILLMLAGWRLRKVITSE